MKPTPHEFFTFDLSEGRNKSTARAGHVQVSRLCSEREEIKFSTIAGAESFLILAAGALDVTGNTVSGFRKVAVLPASTPATLQLGSEAWVICPVNPGAHPAPWERRMAGPLIYDMDRLIPPPDNPRLKMLQSDRMSLNWVRYDGPRDRSSLSPHFHDDFAQAGLALEGRFTHHLRLPWGADADAWCEDVHRDAGPASLIHIPPKVEHTSEGYGEGSHLLVDIFSPPRADYIEKGWILNSLEYRRVG